MEDQNKEINDLDTTIDYSRITKMCQFNVTDLCTGARCLCVIVISFTGTCLLFDNCGNTSVKEMLLKNRVANLAHFDVFSGPKMSDLRYSLNIKTLSFLSRL